MKKIITAILIFGVLCVAFAGCMGEKKATETAFCMDTMINITCYAPTEDAASEAAKAAVNEIRRIEFLLSAHIEDTEIYNINQNAGKTFVKLSEETEAVLTRALEYCRLTDGAFDITIKPLAALWNIKAQNPKVPDKEEIEKAKALVDYTSVEIKDGYISFKNENTKIDLGGAAKGYAADKAVEVLRKHGIKNAILDLGGNVYAMGVSEKKAPWKIGLQDPDKDRGDYFAVEELSDKTCVTSGSYERYFEKDGKIYHHIMDPETGYPADSGLISVSVVGDSSFDADMLSTAIFVMGRERFEAVKDKFNFERYVTVDKYSNSLTSSK